jgi:hypothetical protein
MSICAELFGTRGPSSLSLWPLVRPRPHPSAVEEQPMLPASRPRMPARAEAELGEASDDAADASEPGLDEGPGVDSEDVYDLSRPCDEASVDSDPVNCGRCGHDCLGGTCAAGQCQPVVLMERQPFAPGFSGRWLATDGASLYWWILEVTEPPHGCGHRAIPWDAADDGRAAKNAQLVCVVVEPRTRRCGG